MGGPLSPCRARLMPKYRVQINGQNFLVAVDDQIAKHGFFTWRFVESASPTEAENAATQLLRDTQSLRTMVRNATDDPPVMNVVEIVELESFHGIELLEPGFIWYSENQKRWWQFWRR